MRILTKRRSFDHQNEFLINHIIKIYFALFWDMGTGKTKVAFDKASYLFRQGLIDAMILIAPNNIYKEHVTDESKNDISVPYDSAFWSSVLRKKDQKNLEDFFDLSSNNKKRKLKLLGANTDALRFSPKHKAPNRAFNLLSSFIQSRRVFVVIDEATDFKNYTSQRTKGLLKIAPYCEYRMIMDGTPITQGPSDIYAPFEFLKPGLLGYTDFNAFQARYEVLINPQLKGFLTELMIRGESRPDFIQESLYFANWIYQLKTNNVKISAQKLHEELPPRHYSKVNQILSLVHRTKAFKVGYRNIEELSKKIKPYSSRILKIDCLDLPEKLKENVHYELSGEYKKYYNDMVDLLRTQIILKQQEEIEYNKLSSEEKEESTFEEMTVSNVLVLYMRLQQILEGFYVSDDEPDIAKQLPGENPRLTLLMELMKKINKDYKVIIWSRFKKGIELINRSIQAEYGQDSSIMYYGGVSKKEREENKERFKTDPACRYWVGNTKTGGMSENLQVANYMINYSRDFSLRYDLQSQDRIYRSGQTKNCTILSIICRATIDVKINQSLNNKQGIADYITGDYLRLLEVV